MSTFGVSGRCLIGKRAVFVVKRVKVGGGGCCNDRIEASFQGVLQQQASSDCVVNHRLDARFGCHEGPHVCWSRDVSRSFVSDSGLACAECGLFS